MASMAASGQTQPFLGRPRRSRGARAQRRRPWWRRAARMRGPEVPLEQVEDAEAGAELTKEPKGIQDYLVGTCGFMGLKPTTYAKDFDVVELDFTFHDKGDYTYEEQAAQYAQLGLHVVVKVSRYATHDMEMQSPREWWSWLKNKYKPFLDAGVLVALLWQLPPTFTKTAENLNNLGRLGAQLRNLRQGARWQLLHHVFEFRHASWFDDPEVMETIHRHRLTMACSHFVNETGWAGDMETGWHFPSEPHEEPSVPADDFLYVRCLGTEGRSIGSYTSSQLCELAKQARSFTSAVIVFGQGDAPPQAIENATKLRGIIESGATVPSPDDLAEDEKSQEVVTGTVVASVTRGWNRHAVVDVAGRRGYLGYRHLQKQGLDLKVGTVLNDLHVEADTGRCLFLSAPELVHHAAAAGGA